MTEPTIICPNCKTEIKLNESLAAPLIAAISILMCLRMCLRNCAMRIPSADI